jgi:hypothetical protein
VPVVPADVTPKDTVFVDVEQPTETHRVTYGKRISTGDVPTLEDVRKGQEETWYSEAWPWCGLGQLVDMIPLLANYSLSST